MKPTRIIVSIAALVAVLVAMYAINQAAMRPKPKPDVIYEGRLAHLNETASPEVVTKIPSPSEPEKEEPAATEEKKAGEPAADKPAEEKPAENKPKKPEVKLSQEEKALVDKATGSVVKLETAKGDIVLELYDDKTPVHVGNFLDLVETGFYDGISFHRVIANFMIQGGCPRGDGTGGPGWTIPDEANKGLKHKRGTLSMAKTAAPNTGGSQFFVCHAPQPHLDGVHTVFGECIQGMDVVDKIAGKDKINKAVILSKSASADEAITKAKAARVPER